jgi:hypothetical protein
VLFSVPVCLLRAGLAYTSVPRAIVLYVVTPANVASYHFRASGDVEKVPGRALLPPCALTAAVSVCVCVQFVLDEDSGGGPGCAALSGDGQSMVVARADVRPRAAGGNGRLSGGGAGRVGVPAGHAHALPGL